jgi:hypothetical protein
MIGTVVAWGFKFLTISTENEVYRTEKMPPDGDDIALDHPVEFDLVDNRAVNVKRVYFAPNMAALRRDIHNVVVIKEDEEYCNELPCEGSKHYQPFGRMHMPLTKKTNTLDVMVPIMKKLGANFCYPEGKPIKLKVMDGDKSVDVYDHSFQGGLIATLTRVKDAEAEKKAWDEFMEFHSELHDSFFSLFSEHVQTVNIQKELYFGSKIKRKYNQFKYRSAKYDHAKI